MPNELYIDVNLNEVELKVCVRCGYSGGRVPIESHHITYNPDNKVYLCKPCHVGITVINTWYAIIWGYRLRNDERVELHKWYMRIKWRMSSEKELLVEFKRGRLIAYYEELLPKLRKRFLKKFRYE